MKSHEWRTEYSELIDLLTNRLADNATCFEVICSYEALLHDTWEYAAQLIGAAGTRAVLDRSVRLAAHDEPVLRLLRILDGCVDFSELRDHVAKVDYAPSKLAEILVLLSVTVFQTMSQLAGEAITRPLLRYLDKGRGR